MRSIENCPLCHTNGLDHYLSCKDYTATQETFTLQKCSHCGFLMTNPRPAPEHLPKYYESNAYISHSDTSSGLFPWVYKMARKVTLRWKYNIVRRHTQKELNTILDYGCGTGDFLRFCKQQGHNIIGVEPSNHAREEAIRRTGGRILPDIHHTDEPVSAITLWHVLEHISDLHETMDALCNRLTDGGNIYIAVPNYESLDAEHYQQHWAAYDVPRHLWHFSRSTMESLLEQHDLKIQTVLPMPLDAYYVSLLSEKYRRSKHTPRGIVAAVLKGLKSNTGARTTGQYSSLIYIARK